LFLSHYHCLEHTVIALSDWYGLSPRVVHRLRLMILAQVSRIGSFCHGHLFARHYIDQWKRSFSWRKNIELSVVNVQQGKRYRFHVISMSCDPNFTFSIDGHNLTIIETDSIATSPHIVDSFQIFTGILLRGSLVIATNL